MTEIRLLAVPYEVGAPRMGVGRGPERLLEAGAEEALGSRGARVRLELIELEEHEREASGASEAGAGFELIRLVASRVRAAIDDGAFPVLLSGSCFAGIGVVTGMDERGRES
jgi:arginase